MLWRDLSRWSPPFPKTPPPPKKEKKNPPPTHNPPPPQNMEGLLRYQTVLSPPLAGYLSPAAGKPILPLPDFDSESHWKLESTKLSLSQNARELVPTTLSRLIFLKPAAVGIVNRSSRFYILVSLRESCRWRWWKDNFPMREKIFPRGICPPFHCPWYLRLKNV